MSGTTSDDESRLIRPHQTREPAADEEDEMYELHQIEVARAIEEHRREELTRSWAHHRSLLGTLLGGRKER